MRSASQAVARSHRAGLRKHIQLLGSLAAHLAELGEEHGDGEVDCEVGAEEHDQDEIDPAELRDAVLQEKGSNRWARM